MPSSRVSNHISAEEIAEEERRRRGGGVVLLQPLGVSQASGPLPRCELSSRCSRRVEVDIQGGSEEPELRIDSEQTPVLGRAWTDGFQRGRRQLAPGSAEDVSQRKAVEELSKAGNKEAPGASNVIEVEDIPEVEVPLSRKRKARSTETGTSQPRGSTVDVDTVSGVPPLQRTLAVNPSGEVVLEGPSRPTPGSGDGGPSDSKRRFRELIGDTGREDPG
ncbi:hypothetical protein Adt_06619 [Abeliophyllum distichum]|uniref:Uncharacterized protein n=1 Tax=Abeliophyllum distichum TaxID=126358 RepID=A0ABD1V9M4_9LAMI